MVLVDVILELCVAQFVARLELAVVLTLLLDSIIGQMDHFVVYVMQTELSAGRPYVPFLIVETLEVSIDTRCKCVGSNIKLSFTVEKRIVDVLLDDPRVLV